VLGEDVKLLVFQINNNLYY